MADPGIVEVELTADADLVLAAAARELIARRRRRGVFAGCPPALTGAMRAAMRFEDAAARARKIVEAIDA